MALEAFSDSDDELRCLVAAASLPSRSVQPVEAVAPAPSAGDGDENDDDDVGLLALIAASKPSQPKPKTARQPCSQQQLVTIDGKSRNKWRITTADLGALRISIPSVSKELGLRPRRRNFSEPLVAMLDFRTAPLPIHGVSR